MLFAMKKIETTPIMINTMIIVEIIAFILSFNELMIEITKSLASTRSVIKSLFVVTLSLFDVQMYLPVYLSDWNLYLCDIFGQKYLSRRLDFIQSVKINVDV